jgi:putative salt-induced outer membrane protein YdiY
MFAGILAILICRMISGGMGVAVADDGARAPISPGSAEQADTGSATSPPALPQAFSPPAPNPKDSDWLRLKSGEWLKGDIILLRDEVLEFDSDKLDKLELDWDDVAELRSPRLNTCLFEGRRIATGTLLIREGIVVVGGETEQRFKRQDLQSIIPGKPTELNFWSGKVSIGLTARSGNTNQTEFSAFASARRETPLTRLDLDYRGNIGQLEGVENVNNHTLNGRFDVFLTRRLSLIPMWVNVFRDPFQNIGVRVTPAVGVGYRLFKHGDFKWDVALGPAMQYTRLDSVAAGEPQAATNAAMIFATRLEKDLTSRIDLKFNYNVQIGVPDTVNTNQHLDVGFSVDLIGELDLDLTFVWDRVGDPQPDAAGNVPKKDDFRLSLGLGLSF